MRDMHRPLASLVAVFVAGVAVLTACAGSSTGSAGAPADPAGGNASEPARQVQGLEIGRFFAVSCGTCHGPNGEGGVGPALTADRLTESDAFYEGVIANGRPGTAMPSWSRMGITDEEVTALVQWLKGGGA